MLASLLRRAEAGEALWLPDLRALFSADPGARPLILRLSAPGRPDRDFRFPIPRAENAAERAFLLRCLEAEVYNILSAWSGASLRLFCGEEDRELLSALPARFECPDGLGKVRNIAGRVYGGFSFCFSPLSEYAPLPPTPAPAPAALGERLRGSIAASDRRGCAGLDVGGSDIKLAASLRGELLYTEEYDWNPAASPTAEGIVEPILSMLRRARGRIEAAGGQLEAVGLSFPDIVIDDRIVGGETPKTKGMRENPALDYEAAFARLREIKGEILALCAPGGRCRICNDGSMAAFTAAAERAAGGADAVIAPGVIAHTLGTDLGSGWLLPDGTIPPIPLEMYDLLLDMGSLPSAAPPPEDLRSSRNENSGLPGLRRCLGQAAAYRLAWELEPALLEGFVREEEGVLSVPTEPVDLRKPCLAHLMAKAEEGSAAAEEIFRRIGRSLAMVSREMDWLYGGTPPRRFLFGRFVKSRRCFGLLREGFEQSCAGVGLLAADEELANSGLMRQLAARPELSVAQFGQAVGAVFFALS